MPSSAYCDRHCRHAYSLKKCIKYFLGSQLLNSTIDIPLTDSSIDTNQLAQLIMRIHFLSNTSHFKCV